MAKRLYQPINLLCTEIEQYSTQIKQEYVSDEIDMLKNIFAEMNTFCSNTRLTLKQYEEMNKAFCFRSFLEGIINYKDYFLEFPEIFDKEGNGLCEIILWKINDVEIKDLELFTVNLQEVIGTYLKSTMKGNLTRVSKDTLVALISDVEENKLYQSREVLLDTITRLTNQQVLITSSRRIRHIKDVLPQYQKCVELMKHAVYYGLQNEVVTEKQINSSIEVEKLENILLSANTALIRSIVGQDKEESERIIRMVRVEVLQLSNLFYAKDILKRLLETLREEFMKNESAITLELSLEEKSTLEEGVSFLEKVVCTIVDKYKSNSFSESKYCEEAQKYINDNFERNMNITDVADSLYISYSYLSRVFHAYTGMSLSDYLNKVRIEKSKNYLLDKTITINDIAEKVGYNNIQSYQRYFKKYCNMTPSDYRKFWECQSKNDFNSI